MITINTENEKYFTLDGIRFARIYQPLAQGSEAIGIYNIFDTKQQLLNSTKYDEFTIDGVVYSNQETTITALLNIVYSTISEAELEELTSRVENLEENQYSGVQVYNTLADLPATGTLLVSYKVANDPTSSNNGYYHWNGSSYTKDADLVVNEITATNKSDAVSGFAVDQKIAIADTRKLYTESGYYNLTGVLTDAAGTTWVNTGKLPITEAIVLQSGFWAAVATVAFFDIADAFLGYWQIDTADVYEVVEIPSGASTFVASTSRANMEAARVYAGNNKIVGEAFIDVFENINQIEEDVQTVDILDTELTFPNVGWYSTSGVFTVQAGFTSTDKITLGTESILLYTKSFAAPSTVADICFFDASDNFIEAERINDGSKLEARFYLELPYQAVKFAITKTDTVTEAYARQGDAISLQQGYEEFKEIYSDLDDISNIINTVNAELDYLEFPNVGWYSTSGVFTAQSGFLSTDILTLGTDLLILYTKTFTVSALVADICFFDASDVFISSERLNDGSKYEAKLYEELPDSAVKFAITIIEGRGSKARQGEVSTLQTAIEQILSFDVPEYKGKSCLYIGDSISTSNLYKWKGFLEESFNFIDIGSGGTYAPAAGGKKLWPPVTENPSNYSMWYLCGVQRLTDYEPDVINLFGGTNDMGDLTLDLGLATDTPYLDTDGVRPSPLTWASAFKGCIEMLQRDFPDAEIVINTVMNVNYGQDDYDGTYTFGEFMARLQMEIALDYGLKCVPFYWSTDIKLENYEVFLSDSVHPNEHGARRMTSIFAETLFLK